MTDASETLSRGRTVAEIIDDALKIWEKYDFKDDDLWEAYRDEFANFSENDFKPASVSNSEIRRLRSFLRKRGVWIEMNKTITVAKALFNTLQEEDPVAWTESEIKDRD